MRGAYRLEPRVRACTPNELLEPLPVTLAEFEIQYLSPSPRIRLALIPPIALLNRSVLFQATTQRCQKFVLLAVRVMPR